MGWIDEAQYRDLYSQDSGLGQIRLRYFAVPISPSKHLTEYYLKIGDDRFLRPNRLVQR
jgi:hypothetical protein